MRKMCTRVSISRPLWRWKGKTRQTVIYHLQRYQKNSSQLWTSLPQLKGTLSPRIVIRVMTVISESAHWVDRRKKWTTTDHLLPLLNILRSCRCRAKTTKNKRLSQSVLEQSSLAKLLLNKLHHVMFLCPQRLSIVESEKRILWRSSPSGGSCLISWCLLPSDDNPSSDYNH